MSDGEDYDFSRRVISSPASRTPQRVRFPESGGFSVVGGWMRRTSPGFREWRMCSVSGISPTRSSRLFDRGRKITTARS